MSIASFLVLSIFYAQSTRYISIRWKIPPQEKSKKFNPLFHALFDDDKYVFEDGMVFYMQQFEGTLADVSSVKFKAVSYSPLPYHMVKALRLNDVPDAFSAEVFPQNGRNKVGTLMKVNAIIRKDGRYYKLDAFEIGWKEGRQVGNRMNRAALTHSPLSDGKWYRFEIGQTGVYKLDKTFLESLGVNTSQIDPRNISIYGWGGQMLPLANDSGMPQELAELAIRVHGENDGSFDAGDYILFYGTGREWNPEYQTHNNIYSDKKFYYLKIGNSPGKRMQAYTEPSGTPVVSFTEYLAHRYYEKDSVNIVKLGKEWYGNNFNYGQATRHFEMHFRNRIASKKIKVTFKLATDNPAVSNVTIKVNNQTMGTYNLPALFPILQANGIHAVKTVQTDSIAVTGDKINISMVYNDNGYPAAKVFLDYISVDAYCSLSVGGKSFVFSHPAQQNTSGVVEYQLSDAGQLDEIWDVTNPFEATYLPASGNNFSFKAAGMTKGKYVTVTDDFLEPVKPGNPRVNNMDLRWDTFYASGSYTPPDYIIIAPERFRSQAERYVAFHQERGLHAFFAPLEEIYLEFGNGTQDIAPIRNYLRYVYFESGQQLKYVTLLGDTSWDFKNLMFDEDENTNVIPSYQSQQSFSLVSSFVTDDFFVMTDLNEGHLESSWGLPDIAIGRIPVKDEEEAEVITDKLLHYYDPSTYGNWHNTVTLLADDADRPSSAWELGLLWSTLEIARDIETHHPFVNLNKIYLDAYPQVSSAGGYRYPDAKRDLLNAFEKGMLILNFIGHGNEYGWTHERIFNLPEIRSLRNIDKLPFVSTVTCEFGRFDNPKLVSGAEILIKNKLGGAVQLLTTTREISASAAMFFNKVYYKYLFGTETGSFTHFRTPGEALLETKNVYSSLNKKISLLGDPAMPLHFPEPEIVITQIHSQSQDTIRALELVRIEGEVQDGNGNLLSGFNGTVHPVIFDKKIETRTLNNDHVPGQDTVFTKLGPAIFRGQSRVNNGTFSFEFIVPKDIKPAYGRGKISLYAKEEENILKGVDTNIVIGGLASNYTADNTPPKIFLYMNDYNFADGGITDANPFLLVKLEDDSGINTVGGVGHDIIAVIDDDPKLTFKLNDYYETEENTYKKGKIKYKLFDLEPGLHTLKLTAWDVHNNKGEAELSFKVVEKNELALDKVLNYPNPFIDYTEFWFTHNRPFEPLEVQVEVYSVTGKMVWHTYQTIINEGFTSRDIHWNGRDDFGNKIGKGVYFYKISVRTSDGKTLKKWEKLVKL